MKYKLIASDLDGTLLNDDKEISAKDLDSIHKLIDSGCCFAFATGRPYKTAKTFFEPIKKDIPLILYNGAVITTSITNKIIYSNPLGYERFLKVYKRYSDSYSFLVWADEELYITKMSEYTKLYISKLNFEPIMVTIEELKNKSITKALIVNNGDNLIKVKEDALNSFDDVDFYFSSPVILEIVAKGVRKDDGIKRLADSLNIDINEVVAIGDEENDIPMIKEAGLGIAMKNAKDEVKMIADYITTNTNNENAISEIIDKIIKGSL